MIKTFSKRSLFMGVILLLACWTLQVRAQSFTNVIGSSGLQAPGVMTREVFDYDNDGYDDLLTYNNGTSGLIKLFKNNHNLTFTDVTAASGLPTNFRNVGAVSFDIDNNGWMDLVFLQGTDSLRFFTNQAGVFTEMTAAFGITNPVVNAGGYLQMPTPIDINKDGRTDLMFLRDNNSGNVHHISVLINNTSACTGGAFNQFIDKLTFPNPNETMFALIDYDNDQDADLLVLNATNQGTPSFVYRRQPLLLYQNTNGNFTDVTTGSGLTTSHPDAFATIWDYNNDGWLDITIGTSDYDAQSQPLICRVFKNNGNGTFTDMTGSIVLRNSNNYYMNATTVDFDNDADFDVYWYYAGYSISGGSQLYENMAGTFTERASIYGLNLSGGTTASGSIHTLVPIWLDADNDGDLDMLGTNEVWPNFTYPASFMRNNLSASTNRYLQIKVVGCESGKDARGVRIEVQTAGNKLTQYFGSKIGCGIIDQGGPDKNFNHSHRFHFGLGAATSADSVIVYWPSGAITRMANVSSNQILTILENPNCPAANGPLTVAITGDTSVCKGQNISLTAAVSGGGSGFVFRWSPVTGLSDSTTASVTATPDSSIIYTVTTSSGPCSGVDSILIMVKSLPDGGLVTSAPDSVCPGGFSQLNVAGYNGRLQWQFSSDALLYTDLIGDTSSTYQTGSLAQTTYYRIKASDDCGADSSVAVQITVNPLPVPLLTASDTLICSGDSTQVCVSSSFTSYLWNAGDTAKCTTASFAGGYWLTVTDANGCSAISSHQNISVYPATPISIIVQGDTLSSFNGNSYQWYRNDTLISGAVSAVYVAQQTGYYSLEIIDDNGCRVRSSQVNVIVSGLEELPDNSFSIYPNPAEDKIALYNHSLSGAIAVKDMLGRLVYAGFISGSSILRLDVSHFLSGIYWVTISTEAGVGTKKFIKK